MEVDHIKLDQQLLDDFTDSELTPMQALWARVNTQAAELDPVAAAYDDAIRKRNPKHQNGFMAASQKICWVTSLKHPAKGLRGGRVFSCPPLLAAQLIVGGTHRISTPEEIAGWDQEQEQRKVEAKRLEAAKTPAPVQTIVISKEAVQAALREEKRQAAPQQQ